MKNLYGIDYCLLFLFALFSTAASAQEYSIPESIIVITSDKKPVQNSQHIRQRLQQTNGTLAIHNLDAVASLEKSFSKNLPTIESEAQAQVHQRMNEYGEQQFETDIIQAYQGLLTALLYDIDRYPVIIFDQAYAIYGMTDLKAALAKYQTARAGQ
ncbi:MAG: TIGR03757 family integrating conjugative element protein [Cellvibrionaceae bacterium]